MEIITYILTVHSIRRGLEKFISYQKEKLPFSINGHVISPFEFILKLNNTKNYKKILEIILLMLFLN